MDGNVPVRELHCDCGYVAHGDDDDELVADVQAHAAHVHGMNLSAELIVGLTHSHDATTGRAARRVAPRDATVFPSTTRRLP